MKSKISKFWSARNAQKSVLINTEIKLSQKFWEMEKKFREMENDKTANPPLKGLTSTLKFKVESSTLNFILY